MNSTFKKLKTIYILSVILGIICLLIAFILTFCYILNPTKQYYGPGSWEYKNVYNKKMLGAFIALYIIGFCSLIVTAAISKKYKKYQSINDQEFVQHKIRDLKRQLSLLNLKGISANSATKKEILEEKIRIEEQIRYYSNDYLNELAQKRAKRAQIIAASVAAAGAAASSAANSFKDGYERGRNMRHDYSSSTSVSSSCYSPMISKIGNTAYTNGTSYTRVGNTVYGPNGTSYTRVGNTVYGPNGTSYTRVGNSFTGSDTNVTKIGNSFTGKNAQTVAAIEKLFSNK